MKITKTQLKKIIREAVKKQLDKTGEQINENLSPKKLIGKEVPAADGGNYGHHILGYDPDTEDYTVQPIVWDTGAKSGKTMKIDAHKLSYRYNVQKARQSR